MAARALRALTCGSSDVFGALPSALAGAALLAIAALPACPPLASARDAAVLTRNDFIEAYVACNNAAWSAPRMTIEPVARPTSSDLMGGIDSPVTRGFRGEQLYFDGVWAPIDPHRPATVGWALATKAFADRGGFAPAVLTRAASLAAVERAGLTGAAALSDHELEAIATEIAFASSGSALTPMHAGTDVRAPLSPAQARTMLARIGSHFDTARRTARSAGAACPAKVLRRLFGAGRG